jgi:hypothetical protein
MNQDEYDSLEKMESLGFEGVDASLEISLMEYGLAWKKLYDGEYIFVYQADRGDEFDAIILNSKDDLIESWMDLDLILSFTGYSEEEFLSRPYPNRVQDLYVYYGHENLFGCRHGEGFIL